MADKAKKKNGNFSLSTKNFVENNNENLGEDKNKVFRSFQKSEGGLEKTKNAKEEKSKPAAGNNKINKFSKSSTQSLKPETEPFVMQMNIDFEGEVRTQKLNTGFKKF